MRSPMRSRKRKAAGEVVVCRLPLPQGTIYKIAPALATPVGLPFHMGPAMQ